MNEELKTEPYGSGNARWWFLTYNNPPENWEEAIDKLKPDFWTGQLEKGNEGTTHVQALLWYRNRVGVGFWRGKPCWHKPIKPSEAAKVSKYCTKEATRIQGPVTRGTPPISLNGFSQKSRSGPDYSGAYALAKAGNIKEIDPTIQIRHLKNLQCIAGMHIELKGTAQPRGLWIFGQPGAGKSHFARQHFGPYYVKKRSKWWDGYSGEKTVIMDDLNPSFSNLFTDLLDWADQYPVSGEVKGSHTNTCYETFIVTSNYLPSDIWSNTTDCLAMQRRFKFINFTDHWSKKEPLVGTQYGLIPRPARDPFSEYLSTVISQ